MNDDLELRKRVEEIGKLVEEDRLREEPLPAPAPSDPEIVAWLDRTVGRIEWRKTCECGLCGLPAPLGRKDKRCKKLIQRRYLAGHYRRSHGMTFSPEWRAYHHAKNRCENPKNGDFAAYGGRGIRFLFVNFDQFMQFLGPRPGPEFSLDRKDVNGPYAPWNCRWTDPITQANNRRPRGRGSETDFMEMPF